MSENRIFENQQLYHVLNRGVDGRKIFSDDFDYYRFIFLLYACNIGSPTCNLWRKDTVKAGEAILAGEKPPSRFIQKEHRQLVDLISLTLLPNHYHSILEQRIDGGISSFMQKIGNAYSKYFNFKYRRVGRFFQGPFKAILIDDDDYLLSVSRYVHLNVLDLIQPDWREGGVNDWDKAMSLLFNYKWSTAPDYLGARKSKIVTSKGLYNTFFDNFNKKGMLDYKKFLMDWAPRGFDEVEYYSLEKSV